ncbi:DUF1385 domain-containing protein [Peptacetobacter hominis]|uniref:DUF1385 domain-containing protein n=1 Tax=Peptacetobacter hominis TaxID=2743610 RepID=A0A544QTI0_9FIRM|nr:DUF1385 domain-containing protein [Peptacetobacter hominis]TQQ83994.1 DUF1385 domain-containing protein [Peptacetobacter hominis]
MSYKAVGGQAVIEGVMMQSDKKRAVAIRKTDGDIDVKVKNIKSWVKDKHIDKVPFLRGMFILIETMIEGMKCLNYSSERFMDAADEEEDAIDRFIKRIFGDKANEALIAVSMIIAVVMSVGLFILIPTYAGGLFAAVTENNVILNLIEGLIRIAILFVYILLISKNKDIHRVYQYHGAEHKSIHCYESGEELTVENARKHTRLHPRCGTNFLFIVMFTSIILFAFLGWPNPVMRILMRIVCIPVVAGVAYEIIRILGKYDNFVTRAVAYPGMMLQYLTTREPDDDQLEVAIASIKAVI